MKEKGRPSVICFKEAKPIIISVTYQTGLGVPTFQTLDLIKSSTIYKQNNIICQGKQPDHGGYTYTLKWLTSSL